MSAVFASWTVVAGQTEPSMFIFAGQSRRVSSENRFDSYADEFGQTSGGRTSHFYGRFWVLGLRPSASQPITKP
jgi:hypothetical protein